MLARDVVLVGGMGYVVPVGGLDITGVLFVLTESLLLHAAINAQSRTIPLILKIFAILSKITCRMLDLFIEIVLHLARLILRHWLSGHTILALDPFTEIY